MRRTSGPSRSAPSATLEMSKGTMSVKRSGRAIETVLP